MNTLYIAGGLWDLILWHALSFQQKQAFSGEVIVFSKAFTKSQRHTIEDAALKLGLSPIEYEDGEDPLPLIKEKNWDQICVSHLSDDFTQKTLKLFTRIPINLLFEGLAAYFPPPGAHSLISYIDRFIHYGRKLPPPDYVPAERLVNLTTNSIAQAIQQTRLAMNIQYQNERLNPDQVVVLVGQHFYRHGLIARGDEFDAYARYIEKEIAAGSQVLWKEHPRATEPFFPKLKQRFPHHLHAFQLDTILPIELIGEDIKDYQKVAGFSSNSLFNLEELFGIPAESLITVESISYFNFGKLERLSLIQFIGYAYLSGRGMIDPKLLIAAMGNEKNLATKKAKSPCKHNSIHKPRPGKLIRFLRRTINRIIAPLNMEIIYR